MNQILVNEKFYVTPEIKRKKIMYRIEFFVSVFLFFFLFSYCIYAEYDRNKSEQVSQEILSSIDYKSDPTIKPPEEDNMIFVVLNEEEERINEQKRLEIEKKKKQEEEKRKEKANKIDKSVYTSKNGTKYTTEAILKIPTIGLEYPILSTTSSELLSISLNKFWGPKPNEIGNYCIAGHYYERYYKTGKFFGRLHTLKNGDKAELTDLQGRTVVYEVKQKYIVEPTDTRCTSQLKARKNNRRELTLITCTNRGRQRLIVKLEEI